MSHMILTKDIFLRNALSVMLQQAPATRKLCLIDIESFSSLGSIYRLLKRKNLSDGHRLIFIGGKDVSSRVLEPLVTIYRKSCFVEFRWQLVNGRTHTIDYALNHIANCRNLSMLTEKEKKTLFALLGTDDIEGASRKIFLSPKTIYTYTRNIGQKLNLKSILHVRQFVFSEFEQDVENVSR